MSLFCWVWVFWDFWWVFRELSFWFVCLCLVIFSLFGGWWGFFVLLWNFFFLFLFGLVLGILGFFFFNMATGKATSFVEQLSTALSLW